VAAGPEHIHFLLKVRLEARVRSSPGINGFLDSNLASPPLPPIQHPQPPLGNLVHIVREICSRNLPNARPTFVTEMLMLMQM
jgi:hypothetical protein